MSHWPYSTGSPQAWCPEGTSSALAIPVAESMTDKPMGYTQYRLNLADRVAFMAEQEGLSPCEVARLAEWVLPELMLAGLRIDQNLFTVASDIVETPTIACALDRLGLSLPATPVNDPDLVDLIRETCLEDWLLAMRPNDDHLD